MFLDLHADGELTLAPGRDIVPAKRLTPPRLSFPPGVETKVGDVLKATGVDAIVQQCNCLTVKAHGLSQAIAGQYLWADPYRIRRLEGIRNLSVREDRAVPGSIQIMKTPTGATPDAIVLYAQWDFGSGRVKRRYPGSTRKLVSRMPGSLGGFTGLPDLSLSLWNRMWFSRGQLDSLRTIHS